jgi:phosphatidylinositol alpha-1,6-mannosyltransferase
MKSAANMLALVTDAYGGRGGIAQYNRDFLGSLAEAGTLSSITVLPRHAPDLVQPPHGIRQLLACKGRIAYSTIALRTALLQPVDVVFCGHLFMAPLAAWIARLKHAKLVVQTHGIEAWSRPSKWQRAAVEHADLVLSVSRHTRAAVLSWAAIAPERAIVVPNTVREMFTPGDGRAQRSALGLEGKRILLTVGRMDSTERYKGHDRVIAALPEFVSQGHDVYYLIVGEGDDRPRLEAMAVEAGVQQRVLFLGGVDSQTLSAIYRCADLFVMASTGEGFGVAFLEAMASGTPAIGLDVGGAPDALGDGELGLVVREDEITEVIATLLTGNKVDRSTLASTVHSRFGRGKFKAAACSALSRLFAAA